MKMFVPLSELVFVPLDTIIRISFFGQQARVEFKPYEANGTHVEILDGEDAQRLFQFVMNSLPEQFRSSSISQASRHGH
jgi:hypothetical protein